MIFVRILLTRGNIRLEFLTTRRRVLTMEKLSPEEFVLSFWSRVEFTDTCWLWKGSLYNGYGSVRAWGKSTSPHRAAWEMLVGKIPASLQVDHLCRVRNCVNPMHMELVTGKVNTLRGNSRSAINARKTHCPQGHPYNRKNTWSGDGMRHCRMCNKLRTRKARAERRGVYGRNHRPMAERCRDNYGKRKTQ